jgi:hypothetical protein
MTFQHLDEIRDRLAIATSVDDVAGAMLQLVTRIREDVERTDLDLRADNPTEALLRAAYVRFAQLDDDEARAWCREAKPWL